MSAESANLAPPYPIPPRPREPSWADGLVPLERLERGSAFVLPGGHVGHVLASDAGVVAVDVPSLPWSGPARGALLVRPTPEGTREQKIFARWDELLQRLA